MEIVGLTYWLLLAVSILAFDEVRHDDVWVTCVTISIMIRPQPVIPHK